MKSECCEESEQVRGAGSRTSIRFDQWKPGYDEQRPEAVPQVCTRAGCGGINIVSAATSAVRAVRAVRL